MCLINVTAVLRLKGSFRYNALYNIHIFDRSMILKKKKKKKSNNEEVVIDQVYTKEAKSRKLFIL